MNTHDHTPIERQGDYLFKRDDAFEVDGVFGGKVRTCLTLSQGASGLVTASSRKSPQAQIVARIAKRLGVPARLHMPTGEHTGEMVGCQEDGAELIQHRPGHNSVIIARAVADAKATGFAYIPFGMECQQAVDLAAEQAEAALAALPDLERIVMPVGSGMSVAGVVTGVRRAVKAGHKPVKIFGVCVGADPTKRLNKWAPFMWYNELTLTTSEYDYHQGVTSNAPFPLDPYYEAKAWPYVQPGDLFWVVGIRDSRHVCS